MPETVCVVQKEREGGEEDGRAVVEVEEEEMKEVSSGGQSYSVKAKWLLTQDISPLAAELLLNKVQ